MFQSSDSWVILQVSDYGGQSLINWALVAHLYPTYMNRWYFFALAIAALYLVVEKRQGNHTMGAFVMPIAFLCLAYASLSPNISDRIQPLLPALKSNWLIAHVITCFIGYAGFAIAFCLSLMVLLRKKNKEGRGIDMVENSRSSFTG